MDYKTHIKSEKWREFCKAARVAAGLKCQRCGAKNKLLEVHHLHYSTLGHESLADVEVLCKDCHRPADRERELRSGLATFSRKKYGDDYSPSVSEMMRREDEYDTWRDRKDGFF